VREAIYMRFIPWTLQSGSEQVTILLALVGEGVGWRRRSTYSTARWGAYCRNKNLFKPFPLLDGLTDLSSDVCVGLEQSTAGTPRKALELVIQL
jgi:hypothetical protein